MWIISHQCCKAEMQWHNSWSLLPDLMCVNSSPSTINVGLSKPLDQHSSCKQHYSLFCSYPWLALSFQCSIGLGASIVLFILAVTFSACNSKSNSSLTSLGLLQIIWLFEHHPELSEILENVEDPTDYNLRTAGLVKVRLADALWSWEYHLLCSLVVRMEPMSYVTCFLYVSRDTLISCEMDHGWNNKEFADFYLNHVARCSKGLA
jgi:hypothetical protein